MITNSSRTKKWWVIPITLLVAFCFFAVPNGASSKNYNPDWISLVLIYWCFAVPKKIGLVPAWLIGLLLDVVSFGTLGRYALSKLIIVFLADRLALRVRMFPVWQQSFIILVLLTIETAILLFIGIIISDINFSHDRWIAVLVGALLWPVIYIMLRRLRHWARLP